MSQSPNYNTKKPIYNIISDTTIKSSISSLNPDSDLSSNSGQVSRLDDIEATQWRTAKESKLVNRRRFMQRVGSTIGVTAAGVSLGLTGCHSDDDNDGLDLFLNKGTTQAVAFKHGIASGDPLSQQVIIWTRVTPESSGAYKAKVNWIIARNAQMTDIVAQGQVLTSAKHDYTVKVDVTNLAPNTVYYYQFNVGKQYSPTGKTKTLPINDVSQVKLAVFSCANYPAGYFHAYADAAKRTDIDACVHLGDYLYEYGRTSLSTDGKEIPAYASASAAKLEREVLPADELVTIDDYRRRYAQYRTDKDLQQLHAALPMIAVWDDHELANDAFETGAENHQPQTEESWDTRKLAAVTAYHEWMPTRNSVPSEIYRRFDFGNLISLHMLDTRVIGRAEQLNYLNFIKVDNAGAPHIDAAAFMTATNQPNRQLLGLKQSNWLVSQMQDSAATWQILGQQVLMARMTMPAPVILNIANPTAGTSIGDYLALASKAKTNPQDLTATDVAILSEPAVPYNLDSWDGYGSARDLVLTAADSLNKNLVVLSGDTHNAWSSNITNQDGKSVGVEFATSSVTSPGFEEYLPSIQPAVLQSVLTQLISDLKYMNPNQRGYMLITATPDACQSDWVFISDIRQPTYSSDIGKTLTVKAGQNVLGL